MIIKYFKSNWLVAAALSAGMTFSSAAFSAEYLQDSSGTEVNNTAKECWNVMSGLTSCGEKKVITISGSGLFDTGKATIRPDLAQALDNIAARTAGSSYNRISITGHTDNVGSDAYNMKLSQRRAASAGAYLISKGLNGSKMYTNGMGFRQPVASNATEQGRQQNRRVVITID